MQVILLEKIRNLGDLGELVNIRSGYGRNYLIPKGKAVSATKRNVESFEGRRAELEAKAAAILNEAQSRAEQLKDFTVTFQERARDDGKLYGSIGTHEIARGITAKDIAIEKSEVLLPNGSLHYVGEHEVDLQLHSDVTVTITVCVESVDK